MTELDPYYSGSKQIVQNQLNALPGETQASIAQADAKLGQANDNIIAGARRRGTGIALGGIPLGEQAQYAATEYAPAIANLKSSQNAKQLSLTEVLNGYNRDQRASAQSIYDSDLARDFQDRQFQEQIRQFNASQAAAERQAAAARAASTADISKYFGAGAGGAAQSAAKPTYTVRNGNNFAFFDAGGQPITAAQYAAQAKIPLSSIISKMAQAGDASAKKIAALQTNQVATGLNAYNLNGMQKLQWQHILGGI